MAEQVESTREATVIDRSAWMGGDGFTVFCHHYALHQSHHPRVLAVVGVKNRPETPTEGEGRTV